MKRIIPILTIIVIISIIILLPREKAREVKIQQVLSVETGRPTPKPTPFEYKERNPEKFGSFLTPKDLQ